MEPSGDLHAAQHVIGEAFWECEQRYEAVTGSWQMDVAALLRMSECVAHARTRRRKGIGTAVAGSHLGDGHAAPSRITSSGSLKRKETTPYEESSGRGRSMESATLPGSITELAGEMNHRRMADSHRR